MYRRFVPGRLKIRLSASRRHQGQVDFADFLLPWGKRHAFLVVLGFSRVLWLQFFTRQTMQDVFEGLETAFTYFGGVPRELLFDQMKAVIIKDERNDRGRLTENAEFLRFASHHDFRTISLQALPSEDQGQGRATGQLRYSRSNFFYGRTFTSDDDLNQVRPATGSIMWPTCAAPR